MTTDVLIIGGGIIGLSIARELRRRDAELSIAVADRTPTGAEASYAAAGMLAANAENETVGEFHRFCVRSAELYPSFAAELLDETGVDIWLERSGTLYAAFTADDSANLARRRENLRAANAGYEYLDAAETKRLEPAISSQIRESLYFPNDWQVENRLIMTALRTFAGRRRIELINDLLIDSVDRTKDGFAAAADDGRRILTKQIVLACGSWTSSVRVDGRPIPVTVEPVRGEIIVFQPPQQLFRRVIHTPRGYLVPRQDGRIIVGATVEQTGFSVPTDDRGIRSLIAVASEIAPALADLSPVETRYGFRPLTGNGSPVIGRLDSGLFLATGHYRNGILLAPATAQLIADSIIDGKPDLVFGPEISLDRAG